MSPPTNPIHCLIALALVFATESPAPQPVSVGQASVCARPAAGEDAGCQARQCRPRGRGGEAPPASGQSLGDAAPGGRDARGHPNIYCQAGALRGLGRVDWSARGNSPTSMVYAKAERKTRTLVAWNPAGEVRTVRFFEGAREIGSLEVAPRSMASVEVWR